MTQELEQKLFEKYPKIFAGKDLPIAENLLTFRFEHGNGWYWLLDTLCDHIQTYIDNNKHLHIEQVVVDQVKEKFGTLRFYYDGGDEYIRGIVSHAEFLSGSICEMCGSTKEIGTTQGWLSTLCYEDWSKNSNFKKWRHNETKEFYEKIDFTGQLEKIKES